MSKKFPVIAVTGSSGAGTTTVKRAFENIFRREFRRDAVKVAIIEGDSLHSLDRMAFRAAVAEATKAGNHSFSHFGPEARACQRPRHSHHREGAPRTPPLAHANRGS